jgi:hypothetical protein
MSDALTPSELSSASELGDVVDALEREIATFRRLREDLTSAGGGEQQPSIELAGLPPEPV